MALAPTQAPAKPIIMADQKEVKSSIRHTEATLAATPEDDTEIRDILTARLAEGTPLPSFVRTRWGTIENLRQRPLFG